MKLTRYISEIQLKNLQENNFANLLVTDKYARGTPHEIEITFSDEPANVSKLQMNGPRRG